MDYVQIAIPFFILAILLEFIFGVLRKRQTYRLNDTVNSLQMGMLSGLFHLGGVVVGYYPMVGGSLVAVGFGLYWLRFLLLLETSIWPSVAHYVGVPRGSSSK